jgi:hypothetical protein
MPFDFESLKPGLGRRNRSSDFATPVVFLRGLGWLGDAHVSGIASRIVSLEETKEVSRLNQN